MMTQAADHITSADARPERVIATTPEGRRFSFELALIAVGLALLFLPTYYDLARGAWSDPHESHGPFVLAIAVGVAFTRRRAFMAASGAAPIFGTLAIITGVLLYVVGRSQEFLVLETAAQLPILIGVLVCLKGWPGLRVMWFPVAFMIFTVVWPGWLIDQLTLPLKQGVSALTVGALEGWGYPISSTGVTIMVGPYQLLVADACSGLNTIVSLLSVGVLYLYMVRRPGIMRNVAILLAMPFIAFAANVLRVMGLTLITYHFGERAGDSFLHDFAGLFLFGVALLFVFLIDSAFEQARRMRAWHEPRNGRAA
jgi:exosortase B